MRYKNLIALAVVGLAAATLIMLYVWSRPEPTAIAVPAPPVKILRRTLPAGGERTPAPALPRCGPASPGPITTDPTAKNYDPIALFQATQTPPADIFKREPRDLAFASWMEPRLRWRLIARLGARFDEIPRIIATCHTSSCEVIMKDLPEKSDANTFLQALDLDKFAGTIQVGPAATRGQISIVMLFAAAQRDTDAFAADMQDHSAGDFTERDTRP